MSSLPSCIRNCLLFSILLSLKLYAGIVDQVYEVPKNKEQRSLSGIDCTYIINLDKRPERLERSLRLLAPYGIIPLRFPAVEGISLPLSVINDCGIPYSNKFPKGTPLIFYNEQYPYGYRTYDRLFSGQTCFTIGLNRGAIGCALSHISILKDAYDSGYKRIMILEDDFKICRDLNEIPSLIDELESYVGEDWDIFFTDPDSTHFLSGHRMPWGHFAHRPDLTPDSPERFFKKTFLSPRIFRTGARYGAYSMVISRRGIGRLLDYFKTHNLFDPIDCEYVIPDGVISLYCSTEDIITHGDYKETDIQEI